MSTQTRKPNYTLPIVVMFFLFAMISFVTGFQNPFGVILKAQLGLSNFQSQLGAAANFIAYAIMGIPAGILLQRKGYKFSAISAVLVGLVGVVIMFLSSLVEGQQLIFTIYLIGALVAGFSMCMLNTVVNPMLNLLGGGGNKGNQLIQTGGALNSLAGTLTPMMVGVLVGTLTKETTMASVAPLVVTGIVIFVLAFIVISFVKLQEPQANLSNVKYERSPLAFRHCLLGIIAIFFYVGIEIGIPGEMNAWISRESFEGAAAVAGSLAALYWLMMLVGRFLSSIISGKVSTRAQLITASSVAIVLVLFAIFLPEDITFQSPQIDMLNIYSGEVPMKCLFLFLCGLCTSVMWGGIFNLATEGLGKYTAKASGLFMMMVVGGGIMPFIQDWIGRTAGYVNSYWLVLAMLVYIFYYAIIGSKNVNTDIPVSLEDELDPRDL